MWWKELKLGPSLNKNRWKNTDRPHQCSMTYIKPPSQASSKPVKNHIRINFLLLSSVRPTAYKHWGMTQKWVTRGHPTGFHPTNWKGSKSLWLLKPSWNFKPSEKEQFFPSPTPSLPAIAVLALDSIFTCPQQNRWPALQLSSQLPIVPVQHWHRAHVMPQCCVRVMLPRCWGGQK